MDIGDSMIKHEERSDPNTLAYCGLDCNECATWFKQVGKKIKDLNTVLDERNFAGISKEIGRAHV